MPSHIHSTARLFRIASIPGDGIGPEVTDAAIKCLQTLARVSSSPGAAATLATFATSSKSTAPPSDASAPETAADSNASNAAFAFTFETFDWNSENYLKRGWYMPDDGIEQLKKFDAVYFGAVGDRRVPDHISLWKLILIIRKELYQWVNVRPSIVLPGTISPLSSVAADPSKLDWLIIRENSEGEYAGQGGISHTGTPFETGTELSIFTRPALERIFRFAFEQAAARPRKKLTMVTKSNAQRYGMVLWDKVFWEVAKEWEGRGVEVDTMLVDAVTVRMTINPQSLDTIVATNLHADILSDLAAALAGSIGIAPSSNLNPERTAPSMFEPIHGSAPDIVGQGVANPLGAIWSAGEMVKWLAGAEAEGTAARAAMEGAAVLLEKAIGNVCEAGVKTRDLGGDRKTVDVTEAVCREIEKLAGV